MPSLSPPRPSELRALCLVLWNWSKYCQNCPDAKSDKGLDVSQCNNAICPFQAKWLVRRQAFLNFYQNCTSGYSSDTTSNKTAVLQTHQDLLDIISFLKTLQASTYTRKQCIDEYFKASDPLNQIFSVRDQEQAFLLAAHIMTMVSLVPSKVLSAASLPAGRKEKVLVVFPDAVWDEDKSLHNAIRSAFVKRTQNKLQGNTRDAARIQADLTAANLIRRAKLEIHGTDELRKHLMLRHTHLYVFRHIGFLKELLMSTKEEEVQPNQGPPALPREVALEALETLYTLFPRSDGVKTSKLLERLIREQDFDSDYMRSPTRVHERQNEASSINGFPIWGERLMVLYEEIQSPSPRNWIEEWLDEKTRPSYGTAIAVAGIFVALVTSFLALIVSSFQAVVAWNQWKYPVSPQ